MKEIPENLTSEGDSQESAAIKKEVLVPPKIAIVEDNTTYATLLKETILSSEDFKDAQIDWIDPASFAPGEPISDGAAKDTKIGQRIVLMKKFENADNDKDVEFQRSIVLSNLSNKLSQRNVPQQLIDTLSKYDLVLLDNSLDNSQSHYRGVNIAKLLPKSIRVISISGDDVHYGEASFKTKALLKFKAHPNLPETKEKLLNLLRESLKR